MDTNYGEAEVIIVEAGIQEIEAVLFGSDTNAKERLLFYLDWYLDPYYEHELSSIKDDISAVLQNIVIKSNEDNVVDEAIHPLSAYIVGPYEIIKEHISSVPQKFKSDVLYLMNENM